MKTLPDEQTIHAWVLLHRAHRKLIEAVGHSLKRSQMPPLDWYDILLELNHEAAGGLRQYEIGERILLSKHNLSRLIDRLEKQGLVRRESCEEDGRGNRVIITAQGKQLLKRVWPVYGEAMQKHFGDRLQADEISNLQRLLSKVID